MLDWNKFIEKNKLQVESQQELDKIIQAMENHKPTGLVSRGPMAGMVPAGLECLGMNSIFPNGVYISHHREDPCANATLYLIPKAISLGIEISGPVDADTARQDILDLCQGTGSFPQAIKTLAFQEGSDQALAEQLAKAFDAQTVSYSSEAYNRFAEPLSQIDIMVGKKPDDAVAELLARSGAEGGELYVKAQSYENLSIAMALTDYVIEW